MAANADFAYEGHFTNDATWGIPQRFKDAAYSIHMIFFGLTDIALSETRVVARAQEGGHYVDPLTLSANFYGNLEKLDKYYPMFDSVEVIDTSGIEHTGLAILEKGVCTSALAPDEMPVWFAKHLLNIISGITQMP